MVADEPTANLDSTLSQGFINEVEFLKSLGKTVIVATHDPIFNDLDVVDRVITIKDGQID